MIIIPAVDILGGQCVRLVKGEYGTASKVAEDACETAASFSSAGAGYVHFVDLDGARSGRPENARTIINAACAAGVFCEVGGGIRNMETVDMYLSNGLSRVILGTSAIEDRDFLVRAVEKYAERISVGVDAKNGYVCVRGWEESSGVRYDDFAAELENIGVRNIIFTDIDKDGTLTEPNFTQLGVLLERVGTDITASGGIRDISHIRRLAEMGVYGAICGKSLYSGTLDLGEALRAVSEGKTE